MEMGDHYLQAFRWYARFGGYFPDEFAGVLYPLFCES